MRVISKINNNVALCLDSKGNEVIIFGKGVGFESNGKDIELSKIERTFYNLDNQYIKMLNDVPLDIYRIAELVINYASSKLLCELNSNLLFSLADHINYAIERSRKGLVFKFPVTTDIENLFEVEMEIGYYALELIKEKYGIDMPSDEAAFIALNILNSEHNPMKNTIAINEKNIIDITSIIEKELTFKVNKKSFSYSRFVTHMFYLFKRDNGKVVEYTNNKALYKLLIKTYPETYQCVLKIKSYFSKSKNWDLSEDECLYLMLHINRLCNTDNG